MIKCGKIKIHMEVPTLLLFFAYTFAASVTQNLIIYRTCYVTMGFNKSDCELLGSNYSNDTTSDLEKKVQPNATLILISLAIVEAIFPPIFCLFLGPWTDMYGRKSVLLSSLGGCVLSFVVLIVVSSIPYASPWYLLLFLVPMCLSGGVPALLTAILCYITDVTSLEYRGIRMGIIDAVVTLGTIIGTSSSSFVLNSCGYVTIYSICAGCVLLAWLYILFFIPESVENIEQGDKLKNLFSLTRVKESIRTSFRSKENYDRGLLLVIITLVAIFVFSSYGDSAATFLYLRERFHWTLQKYTLFSSITNILFILGAVVGVILFNKILHVGEPIVILIGCLSIVLGSLLQGLAVNNLLVYMAALSKAFSGAVKPLALALLSKLIAVEDCGKVFSVSTSLQAIGALLGTGIYTYIYNVTLPTFSAAFNFVTCGIHVLEVVLVILILFMQRHRSQIPYNAIDA